MEIRFESGKLLVATKHRGRGNLVDVIIMVLLKTWLFRRFSEGRFITMGRSSRQLLLSMSLGLEALVLYVKAQGASQYYIGGFAKHLTEKVKALTCLVAMASRVSDGVLQVTMRDDRLPVVLPEIDQLIKDELIRLSAVPASMWSFLSKISGTPAARLRSDAMMAGVTSAGYIQGHLRAVRRGAWGLLQGDLVANLTALAAGPRPDDDENKFKMFEMLRVGMGAEAVLEGLRAMARCSWSTLSEEQGHVAASGLMKLHREYGASTLQCRAMMLQCRPFFTATKEQQAVEAKRRQVAKLETKHVAKFTGRQLFLKYLTQEVDRLRSNGRKFPAGVKQTVFNKHGARWRSLPDHRRRNYEWLADKARDDADAERSSQRRELLHEIELLEKGSQQLRPADRPVRLTDCKLSGDDLLELEAMYSSPQFSKAKVDVMAKELAMPYQPPPPIALKALQTMQLRFVPRKHKVPEWVRFASWNRNWAATCIFKVEEPDGPTCWKFVFGKQNPLFACMIRLVEKPSLDPLLGDVPPCEVAASSWDFCFEEVLSDFAFSDDGRWSPDWPCTILPGVTYSKGRDLVGDGPWLDLETAKAEFPELPPAGDDGEDMDEAVPGTFDEDIYTKNPWLADYLKWGKDRSADAQKDCAPS